MPHPSPVRFRTPPLNQKRFLVHARHVGPHRARVIEEVSFEAAAVAYAEDLHPPPEGQEDLRVVVRELDTGHEHSFLLDLGGV